MKTKKRPLNPICSPRFIIVVVVRRKQGGITDDSEYHPKSAATVDQEMNKEAPFAFVPAL